MAVTLRVSIDSLPPLHRLILIACTANTHSAAGLAEALEWEVEDVMAAWAEALEFVRSNNAVLARNNLV